MNMKSSLLGNQLILSHIQKRTPVLIDFFVVKNMSNNYINFEGFELNSDHSSVYLIISDKITTKDQNAVLTDTQTGIILSIYKIQILISQYRLKLMINYKEK
jgi:hypothetical protein